MKKIIYGIGVLAFVSISATNVNVALRNEKSATMGLIDAMVLTKRENPEDGENPVKRIKFSYDASGNRVLRENVIFVSSNIKSSSVGKPEAASAEKQIYKDVVGEMKVAIYPNPTRGMLRVDISGVEIPFGAKLFIHNFSGAVIQQLNGLSESNMVDISSQPAGIYIMKISLGMNQISIWKIIKE